MHIILVPIEVYGESHFFETPSEHDLHFKLDVPHIDSSVAVEISRSIGDQARWVCVWILGREIQSSENFALDVGYIDFFIAGYVAAEQGERRLGKRQGQQQEHCW